MNEPIAKNQLHLFPKPLEPTPHVYMSQPMAKPAPAKRPAPATIWLFVSTALSRHCRPYVIVNSSCVTSSHADKSVGTGVRGANAVYPYITGHIGHLHPRIRHGVVPPKILLGGTAYNTCTGISIISGGKPHTKISVAPRANRVLLRPAIGPHGSYLRKAGCNPHCRL